MNFLSAYERFDGIYEYSIKKIALNYIFGFFWIDFMAILPIDLIIEMSSSGAQDDVKNSGNAQGLVKILRLNRLYRLLRIVRIIKLLNMKNYSLWLTSKIRISRTHSRILKLISLAFLLVHLFSCFYYMASKFHDFSNDTWVVQTGTIYKDRWDTYFTCLYWAFQTLTTVGYGDISPQNSWEIAISCIWMAFGVAFYSIIVGSLTSIITDTLFSNDNLPAKL